MTHQSTGHHSRHYKRRQPLIAVPNPWDIVFRGRFFLMESTICAVIFTNDISSSNWTWQNLWNLLTINFNYKCFPNYVHWSGLYLQVYIPSWLAKTLGITSFRLLQNTFVKRLCPWHDLIINPSCKTAPTLINFPKKIFTPFSMKNL